ncbi:hypothetical protein INF70_22160, partial [Enterobacter cloacae complex sp. P4RS]|uniref:hypothetical protein n=1 Tax=Enterobacter cloacae complex sp. P4RS TaxID=2779590 RepID=UPI001875E707
VVKLNSVHILCAAVSLSLTTVQRLKAEDSVQSISSLSAVTKEASGEPALFNLEPEPLPNVAINHKHSVLIKRTRRPYNSPVAATTGSINDNEDIKYYKTTITDARKLIENLQKQLAEETVSLENSRSESNNVTDALKKKQEENH